MALRVPLHHEHERLGARMTEFAGFEMPLLYRGILDEHEAVRTRCGVFDVSHMGNLDLELAPDQLEALGTVTGANPAKLKPGRARYTVVLDKDATIVDDVILYHVGDRLHVVVNAGKDTLVAQHLRDAGARATVRSRDLCILAVQGPQAPEVLRSVAGVDVAKFHVARLSNGFAAGTGYTGEPGGELVVDVATAERLWPELARHAQPCGLGARDSLRLEKGYCLAGNEFEPPVTPAEAGLMWTVDLDRDAPWREALERRQKSPAKVLTGLRAARRGPSPRRGHTVFAGSEAVGTVSSGGMSPTLGVPVALAYLEPERVKPGGPVRVRVREGVDIDAVVAAPPFV